MMTNTKLPEFLRAKATHHGNWLRNRLPAKAIGNDMPLQRWHQNANIIDFAKLPPFRRPGFSFIYLPATARIKKFNAREIHSCFVGMESDKLYCRIYDPIGNRI